MSKIKDKVLLMILDGFGIGEEGIGNAISNASTPQLDKLFSRNPTVKIVSYGEAVGLPEGQMGNSEVGHLNIGAGRIVYQDLSRISNAIKSGGFFENKAILAAFENAVQNNTALHLMGLLSDGGVHSHITHLQALLNAAKNYGVENIYVHCFMDGRDTPPKSGLVYADELERFMQNIGAGKIASVMGRFYAMDRDKRYERLKLAYDALVYGGGPRCSSALKAITESYKKDITDEFIIPVIICEEQQEPARIKESDSVIFYNFRPDRARELTDALTQPAFKAFETKELSLHYVCMTEYDAAFQDVTIAFEPEEIKNTLGSYLSAQGLKQLRIAETEKYAHVTYFLNGGVEEIYEGEDRILIPSPKVQTYDMKPEMSAYEVTKTLLDKVAEDCYDLIVLNYANCDMVGHTGIYEAAVRAVETVDECVGKAVRAARKVGYHILITADHGNAEKMLDEDGKTPFTANTRHKVWLCYVGADKKAALAEGGRLADLAPTILDIMDLKKPAEMTGKSLLTRN